MTGGDPRVRTGIAIVVVVMLLGALVAVFRPGDQASAEIAFANPEAWVEHGLEGELLKVNAFTGEITARVDVAENGAELTVAPHGSGAALMNRSEGRLTLIDGQRLNAFAEIELDLTSAPEDRDLEVYPVADRDNDVVVSDSDQLLIIDPQTSVVESIPLAEPLAGVAFHQSGRLVALTSETATLLSVSGAQVEVLEVPAPVDIDEPRHLVAAGGSVYLADPARLSVSELLESGELDVGFCLSGNTGEGTLFGGSGPNDEPVIAAFNPQAGVVAVSRPTAGCQDITLEVDPTHDFGQPVAHEGFVYVPNYTDAQIHVVDVDQGTQLTQLRFGTRGVPFDLGVRGAALWANQPLGSAAAVIEDGQITPVFKIDSVVAGAVLANGEEGEGEDTVGQGEDVEDDDGLRIIGDSGASVFSADDETDALQTGQGGEASDDEQGDANNAEVEAPLGVGVAIDAPAPAEPEPAELEPEIDPELPEVESEELIANFASSATTATVGEALRFTDFSSGNPNSWTWDFGDGSGARDETEVEKVWEIEGTYLVQLFITNAEGEEATQSVEVTIVPATVLITPTADFTFDRNTIDVGESVTFTSRSTGAPESLQWDFGDGSGDLGEVVSHTFDEVGTFTVTLTASNEAGSTTNSTDVMVLSAIGPPEAVIGELASDIVSGQLVTLRSESLNSPTQFSWDFGDGTQGTGETVRHVWEDPGTYRVRLEVSNSEGIDSTFVDVEVTRRVDPPISRFTQTAVEVVVDEVVTFTDLSTNQPTSLEWDFGDGTTRRGEMVNKRWSEPGTYRVTLDASNEAGSDRSSVRITVVEIVDPPSASFSVSATVVATGQAISFTDQSTDTPTNWDWSFGDGATSRAQSPAHAYAEPGTYEVELRVSNEGGSSTASQRVVVADRPTADFDFVADGRTVTFTNQSEDADAWLWDFGDGNTSAQRSPVHTFATAGRFSVSLVARNQVGESAPRRVQVNIVEPPVAVATCAVVGRTLECDGTGSFNAASYLWTVPDAVVNSSPTQAQTVLAFGQAGRFNVTLVVTSPDGVQSETTIRPARVLGGLAPVVSSVQGTQDADLVTFVAESANSPTEWNWELDGAELVDGGTGSTATFRVPADGVFTGEVWAENVFGRDTDPIRFVVADFTPQASFTWEVIGPALVELINTSEAQGDATSAWLTPGQVESPVRTQARVVVQFPLEGGLFDIGLRVTDEFGTDLAEEQIRVPSAVVVPVASFTWEVIGPGLVEFTNTSGTQEEFTVAWRIPDGEIVTRNRLSTTMQFPLEGGVFAASLTVTDIFGTDVFEENIRVPAVEVEEIPPPPDDGPPVPGEEPIQVPGVGGVPLPEEQ